MSYPQQLAELIEDFQSIDDRMERLEYVFDLASEVNELPTSEWNDATRILGCQSEAHVRVDVDQKQCSPLFWGGFKTCPRFDGCFDHRNR